MDEGGYINGTSPVLEKLSEVDEKVEDIASVLKTIAAAQNSMAISANTMAVTNALAEKRYSMLEIRLENCHEKASGKGMMPIISHLVILVTTVAITLLTVTYVTNQTIKGTLTSFELSPHNVKEVK